MALEEKLANYIFQAGISLAALSRKSGVPYYVLWNCFSGRRRRWIKGHELLAVCAALEVNPMDFAGDKVE